MKHVAILSVAGTLALAATAIGMPQHTQPSGQLLNQLYPGPNGSANFGKIAGGEFTGDLKEDAVFLDGSTAVLGVTPEVFDTRIPFATSVNDVATLNYASNPKHDYVLTVGAAGLVRHRLVSGVWEHVTLRGIGTVWEGAKNVTVGNVDNQAGLDIVGIGMDSRTVLIETSNLDGTYTTNPTWASWSPGVTAVLLTNFREQVGSSGSEEIVLANSARIEVHNKAGGVLKVYSITTPVLAAEISDGGATLGRLAVVTRVGNEDRLFTWGDSGAEAYLSLGNLGVVSIAAGDADHDGDSEVFLGNNTDNTYWKFTHQAAGNPTYSLAAKSVVYFGPDRNANVNHAGIATGDFDSDGKLDVLLPVQGDPGPPDPASGYVEYRPVEEIHVDRWWPGVESITYIDDGNPQVPNQLRIKFTRPTYVLPFDAQTERIDIGVKVYITAELGAGTDAHPLVQGAVDVPLLSGLTSNFVFDVPAGFEPMNSHELLSVIARQRKINLASNTVVDIAPALSGVYTSQFNEATISNTPDTLDFLPTQREPHADPVIGGLDIGPTVPSMPPDVVPEDEEVPVPPGGGGG